MINKIDIPVQHSSKIQEYKKLKKTIIVRNLIDCIVGYTNSFYNFDLFNFEIYFERDENNYFSEIKLYGDEYDYKFNEQIIRMRRYVLIYGINKKIENQYSELFSYSFTVGIYVQELDLRFHVLIKTRDDQTIFCYKTLSLVGNRVEYYDEYGVKNEILI